MKLVEAIAKFTGSFFNDKATKVIKEAGAICYKTENPSEDFIQKRIKSGHTSILEHGNIIFKTTEKMYTFLRHYVMRSGEIEYIKFSQIKKGTGFSFTVSGNCRTWYNLIKENSVKVKNRGYESAYCYIVTMLNKNLPEIFNEVVVKKEIPELLRLKGYEIHFITDLNKELDHLERMTHMRLTAFVVSDIAISREFVRHRKLSYSMESTRYCNYSKDKFDKEITFIDYSKFVKPINEEFKGMLPNKVLIDIQRAYLNSIEAGVKPQIARNILPMCTKTEYYVTGSPSQWNEYFKLRLDTAAHPQMYDIASKLFKEFSQLFQNT